VFFWCECARRVLAAGQRPGVAQARSAATVMVLAIVGLAAPAAAAGGSTVPPSPLTFGVASGQAAAGSVQALSITGFGSYGTCSAPATPGRALCSFDPPETSPVLVLAAPSSGEAVGRWSGRCAGTPGPLCFIETGATEDSRRGGVRFVPAASGAPTATTGQFGISVTGPAPGDCTFSQGTTVTGSGFPAQAAVVLYDDGQPVATGATDTSGNVTLADSSPPADPGIYRTLTIATVDGPASASTDAYNVLESCVYDHSASGEISLTWDLSGLDADSTSAAIQVAGHAPVPVTADASGQGSVTTPTYNCTSGTMVTVTLRARRGTGTHQHYRSLTSISQNCL
jgi:hypothetical protein